jgi:beta-mannosidase
VTWQLKGFVGEEWRWHVNKPWDAPGWLPARVPGSVVDDLVRAGEVATPYFERNSRLAEWAADRTWVYRCRVHGGIVEFGGVDHEATVLVDGEEVAHHVGAFTPFRIEVPEGEHLLAVAVHAAPPSEPQIGRTSRVRVHKSRMSYGWDFCPRLVHQGIWRPVSFDTAPEVFPVVTLRDRVGRVEIDGEVVLEVEQPELWWPNGFGEQRLYGAGNFEVGFRTVELHDYRLSVNGVPMPIRGWNWVPLDVLHGVPRPEKLERLLRLAQRANVNLLRVWGGGLIESEEFYSWCDRLGLFVWQEFSQSSSGLESVPSDDPEFVATLAAHAREIVPRLRAGIPRSRSGAASTSSTPTTRIPRWPRCTASCASSMPSARGSQPRRSETRTFTARGSTRACARTTGTTTLRQRCCTASSASRG